MYELTEALELKTEPERVLGGAKPEHAALFAVWERIDWRLRAVGFDGLTRGERLLHVVFFVVDSDIENGGLHQLFTNSSGDFAEEARAGFREIGATTVANVLDDAINKYFGGSVPEDRDTRDDILNEREEIEGDALWDDFDVLSRRYHQGAAELYTRLLEWVKAHRSEFALPDDETVRTENEKLEQKARKKKEKKKKRT